jgi:hypothetical protein
MHARRLSRRCNVELRCPESGFAMPRIEIAVVSAGVSAQHGAQDHRYLTDVRVATRYQYTRS